MIFVWAKAYKFIGILPEKEKYTALFMVNTAIGHAINSLPYTLGTMISTAIAARGGFHRKIAIRMNVPSAMSIVRVMHVENCPQ